VVGVRTTSYPKFLNSCCPRNTKSWLLNFSVFELSYGKLFLGLISELTKTHGCQSYVVCFGGQKRLLKSWVLRFEDFGGELRWNWCLIRGVHI